MKNVFQIIAFGWPFCFVNLAFSATELAKINGSVITLEEFNKKYQENLKYFQLKPPTKKSVLDDLIKRELGIQEAKKLNLDKDPDVIDRMNTVLYHALLEKKLNKEFEAIQVSDQEAQDHYKKYPEIRTSHIFIALKPNSKPEEEAEARARMKKIKEEYLNRDKMTFAEVAQRFSEGSAAAMGGDLDYQTRDRVDPNYYDTANRLGMGKVSEIIRTPFGLHIIKKTAVKPWTDVDKSVFKRMVFEEKRTQIFEKYMAQLSKQSKVSTRPELIRD